MDTAVQERTAPTASKTQKNMYVTRDIFYLKYGHFKDVKTLLEEAMQKQLMPGAKEQRVFTDFTGDAYRLILENGFDSLADYENTMMGSMHQQEWQQWYERFKPHVERSYREILKQVF